MDIVIVLDGSNSIYPWHEVQNFLSNILSKFHISSDQMQVTQHVDVCFSCLIFTLVMEICGFEFEGFFSHLNPWNP